MDAETLLDCLTEPGDEFAEVRDPDRVSRKIKSVVRVKHSERAGYGFNSDSDGTWRSETTLAVVKLNGGKVVTLDVFMYWTDADSGIEMHVVR
ncbi:MAG: hypothetical protein K8U57_03560 [Planctomycetes bacterium]|nr:hypothetical protein [Planctomycetota bacterium]